MKSMLPVDRYDIIVNQVGGSMEPRDDGDWVEFEEYETLTAINAELLAACEKAFELLSGYAPETANARGIIEAAIANAQPQGE